MQIILSCLNSFPFFFFTSKEFLYFLPVINLQIIYIIINIIIIIIIIIISCKFFTLLLAAGISLGSKWQQVSSGLHDSYDWSKHCWRLDGLDSFSDFWFLQFFFQAFWDLPKCTN